MKYKITFTCDVSACAILIEAVKHPGIKLDGMVPAETETQTRHRHPFVNGKRMKGIAGKDLVIQTLMTHGGVCNVDAIKKEFHRHQFAEASHSPAISLLIKEGKIEYTDQPLTYRLMNGVTVTR